MTLTLYSARNSRGACRVIGTITEQDAIRRNLDVVRSRKGRAVQVHLRPESEWERVCVERHENAQVGTGFRQHLHENGRGLPGRPAVVFALRGVTGSERYGS